MEILFIDGGAAETSDFHALLKSAPSLDVHPVPDVVEGIKALRAVRFDAVLFSIPRVDAGSLDEFARLVAADSFVPVIVLAKSSDEKLAEVLIDAGAQDCLLEGEFDARILVRSLRYAVARKKTERALQESERRYHETVANIPGAVFQFQLNLDGSYEFPFVSEGVEAVIGMTPRETRRSPQQVFANIHPDDLETLWKSIFGSARNNSPWAGEFRYRMPDGNIKWLRGSSTPRRLDSGSVRWDAVMLDITEQKHAEEQLFLSQRLESVGKLAGGIAHDFNNLLTVVSGRAQLMKRRYTGDPQLQSDLEIMEGATKRATALTKQLLAFSRRQMLQPKVLQLNDIIRNMDQVLLPLLGEDVELETVLDESLGFVKVDPAQIEQVILNLAVNARDAMPQGGKLVFETANVDLDDHYAAKHPAIVPGPYVRLCVTDTGVGMDEKTQSQVFEPFFSTKTKKGGSGLGLSTAYGIVKQSGGYIWVYSEPGRGTTFKVYLPLADGVPVSKPKTKPVSQEGQPAISGDRTVLLVEDEDALREVIKEVLKERGYSVLTASNGLEALDMANKHGERIDLMLTDVVMPEMGGPEAAKRIKQQRPNLRVLFMSGYAEKAALRTQVLEDGSNFLEKPFSTEVLASRVGQLISASTPDTAAA